MMPAKHSFVQKMEVNSKYCLIFKVHSCASIVVNSLANFRFAAIEMFVSTSPKNHRLVTLIPQQNPLVHAGEVKMDLSNNDAVDHRILFKRLRPVINAQQLTRDTKSFVR